MAISLSGSLELTGSLVVTGGITMSGSIASASYASNADLLDGRDSLTFANTGSNSFVGQQNINGSVAVTGSLTTTGTITAQTINVQQVTSSIVYSSGSNIFGNSLSNTQSMTGSVSITGSLSVNGTTANLSSYVPNTRTLSINGVSYDLTDNRSWEIAGGVTSFNTRTGAITLTSADITGSLGYTPYNSTNPSGYTTNTGTVTSVSGTGTVSGLTLSGTVTTSGNLTLGGTLSLTSGQVTTALGYTPYNANGNTVLTNANYNSYSPTLTGGGASGTWGISISGTAANASALNSWAYTSYAYRNSGTGYYQVADWIQMNTNAGIFWPSYYGTHIYPNTSTSYTQLRFDGVKGGYDGVYLSNSGVNGLMYDGSGNGGVYREGNGRWYFYYHLGNDCMGIGTSSTSSTYSLYLSKGVFAQSRIDTTILYDTNNTAYYVDPASTSNINEVTMAGNITYTNGRKGLVGVFDPAQTQAIFAMGAAYVLTNGGASNNIGNLYGLAWSYNPNYGGSGNNPQSKDGLNHQLLLMQAGTTTAAMGSGMWTSGNITSEITSCSTCSRMTPYGISVSNLYYYASADGCGFYIQSGGGSGSYGSNSIYMCPSSGEIFNYQGYSGDLCIGGTLTQNAYSDCRYKKNITTIEYALDKLDAIRGVEFDWNELGEEEQGLEGHEVGVIAQEIEDVYPQAVREVSKEREYDTVTALVVDYEKLIPLIIQSIKELNNKVNNLKNQIDGTKL